MTTTIDAENAKRIRRSMDVLIRVVPETGDPIVINNGNLIKAVVSLRSDLSIINPTLPESELNVEAYFDDDISETLAAIPNETPVTYQAGYDSDLSTVRKFYLAEQITWANNVMTIHAVDAVHLMDVRVDPIKLVKPGVPVRTSNPTSFVDVYRSMGYLLGKKLGIITGNDIEDPSDLDDYQPTPDGHSNRSFSVLTDETVREYVAAATWLFHINVPSDCPTDDIWFTYVDAGIPSLRWSKPGSDWDVYEEDCGNVQKKIERKIKRIKVPVKNYQQCDANDGGGLSGGNAEWIKSKGAYLHFEKIMRDFAVRYNSVALPPVTEYGKTHSFADDWLSPDIWLEDFAYDSFGLFVYVNDLENGAVQGEVYYSHDDQMHDTVVYTSFIPWSSLSATQWSSHIGSSHDDSVQLDITGTIITEETSTFTSGSASGDGIEVELTEPIWPGTVAGKYWSDATENYRVLTGFPHRSLAYARALSQKSGSFTWKGDPRMQPRDVFTFHKLDETEVDCTIESITITHEKGGTSAEITYREGIC